MHSTPRSPALDLHRTGRALTGNLSRSSSTCELALPVPVAIPVPHPSRYDTDSSGSINVNELRAMIKSVGEFMGFDGEVSGNRRELPRAVTSHQLGGRRRRSRMAESCDNGVRQALRRELAVESVGWRLGAVVQVQRQV